MSPKNLTLQYASVRASMEDVLALQKHLWKPQDTFTWHQGSAVKAIEEIPASASRKNGEPFLWVILERPKDAKQIGNDGVYIFSVEQKTDSFA